MLSNSFVFDKYPKAVNIGINVNDKSFPFTENILNGNKIYETRNAPSLRPYIGKIIGLIQTGKGKAKLVGYIFIASEKLITNEDEFYSLKKYHLITRDMERYKFVDKKYLYHIIPLLTLSNPPEINSKGIVARRLY